MKIETRAYARKGVLFGLLVGALFAILEMVGAAAMGAPALSPWRAFASTVLGQRALSPETPFAAAFVVGFIAHFALSAIYGVVYGLLHARLSPETRQSVGRETALGLLYGLGLYVLNFQVIARVIYPWFREVNQPWQIILHVIFFGLPLALCFTLSERRHLRLAARPI